MKTIVTLAACALLFSCSNKNTVSIPAQDSVQLVFQIDPPLVKAQPEKECYLIDNAKDTVLITDHGSFVSVPANCFCDNQGKEISGEVSVEFTEYSNTADILLSGIPMQFIENGDTQIFQSAGMCKVEAFSNETVLQLKADKQLSIGLRNQAKDEDYNLYYFDTLQGEWIEKVKDIPILTELPAPVKPINLELADTSRIVQIEIENHTLRPLYKMWHRSKFHLAAGQKFEHPDDTIWWYDMSMHETKNQDFFELSFSGVKEGRQYREKVIVQPMINSSNFDHEMSLFRSNMVSYAKELMRIQTQLENEEREGKALLVKINEQNERDRIFWREAMVRDSIYNAKIKLEDSLVRAAAQKVYEKSAEVIRVFNVARMGIYNCDRFYRLEPTVTKEIKFQVNEEVTIFSYSYLVLPSANTVLNSIYRSDDTYSIALGSGDYFFVGIKGDQLFTTRLQRNLILDETSIMDAHAVSTAELEALVTR